LRFDYLLYIHQKRGGIPIFTIFTYQFIHHDP
jgi:hypothetical protein